MHIVFACLYRTIWDSVSCSRTLWHELRINGWPALPIEPQQQPLLSNSSHSYKDLNSLTSRKLSNLREFFSHSFLSEHVHSFFLTPNILGKLSLLLLRFKQSGSRWQDKQWMRLVDSIKFFLLTCRQVIHFID